MEGSNLTICSSLSLKSSNCSIFVPCHGTPCSSRAAVYQPAAAQQHTAACSLSLGGVGERTAKVQVRTPGADTGSLLGKAIIAACMSGAQRTHSLLPTAGRHSPQPVKQDSVCNCFSGKKHSKQPPLLPPPQLLLLMP